MEHVLEVDNLNMTMPLLFMSPYQNVFHAMLCKTIKKIFVSETVLNGI